MIVYYEDKQNDIEQIADDLFLVSDKSFERLQNIYSTFMRLDYPSAYILDGSKHPKNILKRLLRKLSHWYIKRLEDFGRQHLSIEKKLFTNLFDEINQIRQQSQRSEQLANANGEFLKQFNKGMYIERINRIERSLKDKHSNNFPTKQQRKNKELPEELKVANSMDYYMFENNFRGSEEVIKNRQNQYLKYFVNKSNVLDIGCGRGEFLELLTNHNVECYGIDINPDMVLKGREKDLKIIQEEALSHLLSVEDESLGGIFCSQLIEHLSPSAISNLIELSWNKLKKDSYFICETINPCCVSAFINSFIMDLSHVKPLHPATLNFLFESNHFEEVKVTFLTPHEESAKLSKISVQGLDEQHLRISELLNSNTEKLNQLLFGYQEYAVIAKK
ncbi:MAG: class I SAM-dependent methyltransferase [Actinobacteria bacterium]|nr:MAG: class I SAM-dependent methyltransferase [Actinomycetota bacterium]